MSRKSTYLNELYSKEERDQSDQWMTLAGAAGVGLWDWDWTTDEVYFSPEWKRQLGYADHELPNAFGEWERRLHPDDLESTRRAVSDFSAGRRPAYDAEFRLRHRDGSWRWIFARAQLVRDGSGRPVRMMGCHVDVTDRKQAEAALLASEQRLKYAVEATRDGLWDWDIKTGAVYYSPQWARLLGYAPEEVPQRVEFFFSVLHPGDVDAMKRVLDEHLQGNTPAKQLEIRLRTKAGGYAWFLDRGRVVVRDGEGRASRMVGTITDISERKRTEALLDLQKDVLEGVASGLPLAVSLADIARRIESLSDGALCSILLADSKRKHLHHGAAPSLPDLYCSAIDGIAIGPCAGSCGTAAYRLEQVIVTDIATDPLWEQFQHLAVPHGLRACWSTPILGGRGELLGTFAVYYREPSAPSEEHQRNIRVATSIAAVAINRHLTDAARWIGERAMQAISQGVLIAGPDGEILAVNPAWVAMTGWEEKDLIGNRSNVLYHAIVSPEVASNFARAWDDGADFSSVVPYRRKDGTQFWNELTVKPAHDTHGGLTNYIVVSRDVTERMRVESNAREMAQRLEIALENSSISVWECNLETGRIWLDSTWAAFLGNSPGETVTTSAALFEMTHPDDRQIVRTAVLRAMKSGSGYAVEHRVKTVSGDWRWILSRGRVIAVNDAGRSLRAAGTNTDITERKRAEAERAALEIQLRESQKLEAIGTLAGGIAHDFNNIIAVILGNAELARGCAASEPADLMDCLEEIRKAGTRARSLVRQILSFSRKQPPERKRVALASIVHESVRLLTAAMPARLTLSAQCEPGVPDVYADPNQIEQVLINLVTNAMQAIQHGPGCIQIHVESITLESVMISSYPQLAAMFSGKPRRVVCVRVEDNGPGMDEATKARIFEPFFTTKPPGTGTGLGLSVVHGIVHAHDGAIAVASSPGEGASFALYLPAAPDRGHGLLEAAQPRDTQVPHGARVLYLDDEKAIADVVKKYLERSGHRVAVFSSHGDAINALRQDPFGFDLLITDYNMPGKSGLDVVCEVQLINPRLPCAITSGYVDDPLRSMAKQAGVAALVTKENLVDELGDLVQRMLHKGSVE